MFNFSFYELMVFGIIALIVLGPEKLPQAVRTVGTYYSKFRRTIGTLKAEMEAELDLAETRQLMQKELAKIRQSEAQMQKEMAQLRGSLQEFEQQNSQLKQAPLGQSTAQDNSETASEKSAPTLTKKDIEKDELSADTQLDTDYTYNTSVDSDPAHQLSATMTRPWKNMWFLLGDYDRARRLPPAPFLPNYTANPLLYDLTPSSAKPTEVEP